MHKNEFINVSCPACESNNYQDMFEKNGFNFVICKECETYFINPRPNFVRLMEFYKTSNSYKHWKTIFSATEISRRDQIFIPRVKRVIDLCKKHNSPTEIILDVGAGAGTFCNEMKKYNTFSNVIAVEPTHDLADACREKNLNVIEKPIEEINLNDVSVITCFEVIEHLFCPKDFVLACAKILSKGGLFIITTPNIKGFDLLTLGRFSNTIVPDHLNYFHPKSLGKLLESCGFQVIETLTPGKLDAELVRKKVISREFDISNHPFLKYILIDQWERVGEAFQQFLADNALSSHLWIVAKKN